MNPLTLDIWGYLTDFIDSNEDKYHLLITCKEISKCRFFFYDQINVRKIKKSLWFDNFTNIFYNYIITTPKFVTHLTLTINCEIIIPTTVTHLALVDKFDQPIKNLIPSSIIHLIFGTEFNQCIKGNIPDSVTHLTFGCEFNQSIKGGIPSSVKHLIFGYSFNRSVKGCLTNVTHLTFGCLFNKKY